MLRTCLLAPRAPRRGGYVRDFSFEDSTMVGVGTAMEISLSYGDNPQPPLTYNLSALPAMDGFLLSNVSGWGVGLTGSLSGAPGGGVGGITITGVRVQDVHLQDAGGWKCDNVTGTSADVSPAPCPQIGGRR